MKVQQFVTSRDSFYSLTDEEANILYLKSHATEYLSSAFSLTTGFTEERILVSNLVLELQLSVSADLFVQRISQISHQVVFAQSVFVTHKGSFSSTLGAELSLVEQLVKLAEIINSVALSNSFETRADRIAQIALTMALMHSIESVEKDVVLSQLICSSEFKDRLTTYSHLVEQIQFSLSLNQSLLVLLSEGIAFNHSLSSSAQLYAAIKNNLGLSLSFLVHLDGDTYVSYVVNTKTSGLSEYTDTNFNSMDFPLGCKSDGIYRIDQDKDDSVIASMKTGMIDFGTSLQKQVPNFYLGITNDERIIAKVITTTRGVKAERQYAVVSSNKATDTTRADLGKGAKGKYWQFELNEIKDRVESFEVLYRVLARRK